jgi:Phosphotransferase enzyme family
VGQPVLTADRLAPAVRRALAAPDAQPTTWVCERLDVPAYNPGTAGLYVVSGTATDRGAERPWRMILKEVALPDLTGTPLASAEPGYVSEPEDWNFWKREVLARRSGLLERFTWPVRAVRCWGTDDVDDRTSWLWLEELDARPARPTWSTAQLAEAAYGLGAFAAQGRELVDEVQALPWAAQGWLRGWVTTFLGLSGGHAVAHEGCWSHPLVRDRLPRSAHKTLAALMSSVEQIHRRLDALPSTVAHHDAKWSNLFHEASPEGARTVVIDWGFLGVAPIGQDLGHHIALNVYLRHIEPDEALEHGQTATAAYLRGLRDFGWRGEESDVRFAADAAGSLQMLAFAADDVALLCPDHPEHEDWPGERAAQEDRGVDAVMDTWADTVRFLLMMGERATRALAG